jgi:calcineurin-like phosphoesterase family protein
LKVYVTGDTHCPIDIKKLNSENFQEGKTLTKDDVVIILGDFGLLWKDIPDKEEKYWTNWLNNKPWTTLFVDGNHENHNRLK